MFSVAHLLQIGFALVLGLSAPPPGDTPPERYLRHCEVFVEWVVDVQMTEGQRQEFLGLLRKGWEEADGQRREVYLRNTAAWGDFLPRLSPYQRNLGRAAYLPRCLLVWGKEGAPEIDRWLLALYESTHQPGGPRNPVLAEGGPPLTGGLADRHADYLEFVLDFSASGGLTGPERRQLRDHLVRDWKKMDLPARLALLEAVTKWTEMAPRPVAERDQWRRARQAELLARLRAAGADTHGRWLLARYERERKVGPAERTRRRERAEQELEILRPPAGVSVDYARYDARTGRYDVDAPAR